MSILIWLANAASSYAQRKVIENLSKQTLMRRLQVEAEKWSQELPESALLLSVDSIFVPHVEVALKESAPAIRKVVDKLEKFEIPTAEDWQADFMIQWNWVRRNLTGRAPFFNISPNEASKHLLQLGELLELECQKDPACFQITVLEHLKTSNETQDATRQDIHRILRLLETQQQPVVSRNLVSEAPSSNEGYHSEIDLAADYLRKFQPDIAIAQLTQLQNQKWEQLSDRERFRVLANLGHAHVAKNIVIDAGEFFIKAKLHQPTDEQARSLEALGYSLKGDRSKAFELASLIRSDFPKCDLACATWIRNAPIEMPLEDIEASIPIDLRDSVETASALAWRALELNQLDLAEAYARTALSHDPQSPNLIEPLGIILIQRVYSSVVGQFADSPFIDSPEKCQEAVDLLTSVLTQIPDGLIARKSFIRFQIGRAEYARGSEGAAERNFLFAWEHRPEIPDYARQYALCLTERKEFSRAIEVLRGAIDTDETGKNPLLQAEMMINRDDDGDLQSAFDMLDALRPKLCSYEMPVSFEIIHSLIFICWKQDRKDLAKTILDDTKLETISPFVHMLLMSVYQRRFDDLKTSQQIALTALNEMPPDTPPSLKRMMALHLARLGFDDKSLAVWKEIIQPTYLGFDAIDVLRLAKKCDDAVFVRDFCRELRRNGLIDRDAVHLEINTLLEHNCFETAIEAMQAVLSVVSSASLKREVQLRLSHLGVAIGKSDIVVFDTGQLPSVEDCDPILGITMVEVLTKAPQPDAARRFAYELVREHFESSIAHRAMVISVLGRARPKEMPVDPNSVSAGCAVKYRANDTLSEEWFVIEDGKNPDSTRSEFPPTHPLAAAMIGKQRGGQFELRADPRFPRTATIIDIWTKYKYRFNKCVEEWEMLFPEEFFLWQFPIKQGDQGAELEHMCRSVDEQIEATKQRDEIYRNNPLSTTSYALVTEISVLDAIRHLSREVDLPIRCCLGNDAETTGALRALRNARPLILDGTSLATLFLTEMYLVLPRIKQRLVISEGTLLEWRRALIAAERVPADGGFLSKERNRYVYYANNPEDWARYCTSLRNFLDTISGIANVEEGMTLAHLDREHRRELVGVLGRPAAETIAIAAHRGYAIWTDDRWVGELATREHNVPRVWTGIVAKWGAEEGMIAGSESSRVIVELLRMGYVYTQIDTSEFDWAGSVDNWSPSGPRLSLCLDWLANPHTKDIGILQLGFSAMKSACRGAPNQFARTTIVFHIEQLIGSRPDGAGILRRLFRAIDAVSGVDPAAAEVKEILLTSERVRDSFRS